MAGPNNNILDSLLGQGSSFFGGNLVNGLSGALKNFMQSFKHILASLGFEGFGLFKNLFTREKTTGKTLETSYSRSSPLKSVFDGINGQGFAPLSNLIARAETYRGSNPYNNVFGGVKRNLTDMTIGQVKQLGKSAGKYQVIPKTMQNAQRALGLSDNTRYSEAVQERIGHYLLFKKRDFEGFLNGSFSKGSYGYRSRKGFSTSLPANPTKQQLGQYVDKFITHNMAAEWAGIPRADTGKSFYAGNGTDKASISVQQARESVLKTIANHPDSRLYKELTAQGLIKHKPIKKQIVIPLPKDGKRFTAKNDFDGTAAQQQEKQQSQTIAGTAFADVSPRDTEHGAGQKGQKEKLKPGPSNDISLNA